MDTDIRSRVEKFFEQGERQRFLKGQVIISSFEQPKGVYLVHSGSVEQYDTSQSGNKIVVNIFKSPAFFPMSWVLNDTKNEYYYSAVNRVEVSVMSRDKVLDFVRNNPDILMDLMSRVYRGTDALLRRLILALDGVASNRLIFELLIEAYRFGDTISPGNILVKVSQTTLASRSGLARETVSREFHKLVAEKLVARTDGGVILEIEKLENRLGI